MSMWLPVSSSRVLESRKCRWSQLDIRGCGWWPLIKVNSIYLHWKRRNGSVYRMSWTEGPTDPGLCTSHCEKQKAICPLLFHSQAFWTVRKATLSTTKGMLFDTPHVDPELRKESPLLIPELFLRNLRKGCWLTKQFKFIPQIMVGIQSFA